MNDENNLNDTKTLRIPKELHTRLKIRAASVQKTLFNFVIECLERELSKEQGR